MIWNIFIYISIPILICWFVAAITVYFPKIGLITKTLSLLGIIAMTAFIIWFWIFLGRAPMRTMGETRLWYSLFVALIGYIGYIKWKYNWLLSFTLLTASVFLLINILKPEIHSKNLMPALQSIWFIPHVTAYIVAYAFLGAATIASLVYLYKNKEFHENELIHFIDRTVYIGFGLLVIGLLLGAIWAKEAWGDYWSWDPKETWAFITCVAYLLYIHIRLRKIKSKKVLILISFAFILLMITWKGINYLPSAQNSIHVYSQTR